MGQPPTLIVQVNTFAVTLRLVYGMMLTIVGIVCVGGIV